MCVFRNSCVWAYSAIHKVHIAEEARTKPRWAILFADDLGIVSEMVEEVEEELERWRAIIENKGLRISRSNAAVLRDFRSVLHLRFYQRVYGLWFYVN